MRLRTIALISILVLGLLAEPLPAEAQQAGKVPRIGFLHTLTPSSVAARTGAFRQGLRELGYVEGRNIVIEWRYAEGKLDRLPALASELVRLKVDVIVTSASSAALGVKLQYLDVLSPEDVETAFRAATKRGADAVLVLGSPIYASHRKQIADVAVKSRLPTIYRNSQYVEAGGFVAYGVRLTDLDRRAATYVDKILKGAKPADLPVEQPTKFEFVINLKTAKQLGITIPSLVESGEI